MNSTLEKAYKALLLVCVISGLYLTSLYSYLLFHSIAELFSIVIGATIFLIAWTAKDFFKEHFDYLTFIGIAYLFVAILDLLHTLSYPGMEIFKDYDFYANQLWIGARYLESLSLLIPFVLLSFDIKFKPGVILAVYTIITASIIASIFVFKIFPIAFIEGLGQTPFKIISEYIIIGILVVVIWFLRQSKEKFDEQIYNYLLLSVVFTIISEMSFLSYASNYSIINMIGHYFKILSFYMMYKAIIETSIIQPYLIIFKELKDKETELMRKATTDGLTGLSNRNAAFELLDQLIKTAFKTKKPLTICFLDIDDLKKVNDQYGHAAGDYLIQRMASMLSENTRETDHVCRIGGDEFLIIFPECNLMDAKSAIGGIRNKTEYANHAFVDSLKLDFSFGFSEYNGSKAQIIDIMVQEADENMYKYKMEKKKQSISF
jgi:diguanylate cyclase (GGDEF)-like protein